MIDVRIPAVVPGALEATAQACQNLRKENDPNPSLSLVVPLLIASQMALEALLVGDARAVEKSPVPGRPSALDLVPVLPSAANLRNAPDPLDVPAPDPQNIPDLPNAPCHLGDPDLSNGPHPPSAHDLRNVLRLEIDLEEGGR